MPASPTVASRASILPWRPLLALSLLWALAAAAVILDWRYGPHQQRVTIRWVEGIDASDRSNAEAAHGFIEGEEVERDRWVYSLDDRTRARIAAILADPRIADTAHIDRRRQRVAVDAPRLPRPVRLFLEAGAALPFSAGMALIGLLVLWRRRALLIVLLSTLSEDAHLEPRAAPARPASHGHSVGCRLSAAPLALQDDWDWWAASLYRAVVYLLLASMTAFTAWHGWMLARNWDPWSIADWLVTYEGGFVRRGLGGEFLIGVSHLTGVPGNTLAWASFVLAFASFAGAFAVLLRSRRITFWYFVLCVSPLFLLFTFHNPDTLGRKDGLLFATLAAWAVASSGGRVARGRAVMFGGIAVVATLLHEMFLFFSPYFVVLSHLDATRRPGRGDWRLSLLIPAGSALAAGAILAFGGRLDSLAICERLVAEGAPPAVCEGVLSYGRESIGQAWLEFRDAAGTYAVWSVAGTVGVALLPPLAVALLSAPTGSVARMLLLGWLAAVGLSLPLFVLTIDWGRWLAAHATLLTLSTAVLLPDRSQRPFRPAITLRVLSSFAAGAAVLWMMSGWSVRYCCRDTPLLPHEPTEILADLLDDLGL